MFYKKQFISLTLIFTCVLITPLFAYTFTDALERLGPGTGGKKTALQTVLLFHKISAKTRVTPRAQAFLDHLDSVIKNFDFMKLYRSKFMSRKKNGFRTVAFSGKNAPGRYQLDMIRGSHARVNLNRFGNFGTEFGLKKIDKSLAGDRSFLGYFKMNANAGPLSHENGTAFLSGLQKILTPDNLRSLNAPRSSIYPGVQGPSRKLMDEYSRLFPGFAPALYKYSTLRSLLKIKKYKGQEYTQLNFVGVLKRQALRRDYPAIAKYLKNIQGLLKLKLHFQDRSGARLMSLHMDTKTYTIRWSVATRDGKLIPISKRGKPQLERAIQMDQLNKYVFYVIADAGLSIYGLNIETGNTVTRGIYRRQAHSGKLSLQVKRMPWPKVTGRFGYVIPTWMIDLSIPGNVQELAYKMTMLLAMGNEGRGALLNLHWKNKNPKQVRFQAQGSAEIIDNFLIRFLLRIWTHKVKPGKKAVAEFQKLQKHLTGKIITDLRRM